MSAPALRRAAVLAALGAVVVFGGVGLAVRARRDRAAWWTRAERLCACGDSTRAQLGRLAQDARDSGGLGDVAAAQRALLQSDCDDVRVAVQRRAWGDELARRPLRVIATDAHHERSRAVVRSLDRMCGQANEDLWRSVALDLEAHAHDPPGSELHRVRATAASHLAVRDTMCHERERLSVPPRSYVLSAVEADRQASECRREIRARGATRPR